MPATNAAEPVAPGGGQISQAGAEFDPAAPETAGPEPPLRELAVPADAEPALDLPAADRIAPDPDWEVAVVAAV